MSKKYLSVIILSALVLSPFLAYAAVDFSEPEGGELDLEGVMTSIISFVWKFFVGLAVIMFIVAGILFLTSAGDPGKIKLARDAVIWGVVGVIVAIIAFSIVNIAGEFIK